MAAETLDANFAACAEAGVALVEQPLPAGADDARWPARRWPVPVCADESVHDRHGLAALRERYDLINIKLDKTGGLTEALALADEAERLGFGLFVGCMVASSLAMAPALLLAGRARFVDLDGPLAAGEGPAGRPALRGIDGLSAGTGAMGVALLPAGEGGAKAPDEGEAAMPRHDQPHMMVARARAMRREPTEAEAALWRNFAWPTPI